MKLVHNLRLHHHRGHCSVCQYDVADAGNIGHGLKKAAKSRKVGGEFLSLLVQEQILGGERYRICTLCDLAPDVYQNVIKGDAFARSQRHRAELAAAATTARD